MLKNYALLPLFSLMISWSAISQVKEIQAPVFMGSSPSLYVAPLSERDLIIPKPKEGINIVNPRNRSSNKVVPGKGYPKSFDAAWQKEMGKINKKAPSLVFDAEIEQNTPTDPTGAVGPNHYVNACNSSFAIYDKEGNVLSPLASLSSIGGTFNGENRGDPIVVYDSFADRFLITQYSDTPNSFLVAVSQGPDPVNDGWYTYRFETNSFPDYPKFFVWSDGYYITTNKDQHAPDRNEVVFVLERDKMLVGEEAQHMGFNLPGAEVNSFYSPAGFFAVGEELPPPGNSPIIYFQDDSWVGVNQDHLKIWLINVDWENPVNSTIEESQELGGAEGVTPFHSTFDGGSFVNLEQPNSDLEIDALQGAVMYMTPYRRFPTHNSVVFNFVVDVDPSAAEHAGIRWYELRQDSDGSPWRVYQEGTYAPDDSDRWCGSIGIDKYGNIAMGLTVMNNNPMEPVYPSLRYTGRYVNDPLGKMTVRETSIVEGPGPNPSFRYGDYAHLTIDPTDGSTFWYIGEYFEEQRRKNKVAVFDLEPEVAVDVGIVEIISPTSSSFGDREEVRVAIRNFGFQSQSNIPVTISVEGGQSFTETFTGTLPRTSETTFTLSSTLDLSKVGETYRISAYTSLLGDEKAENDTLTTTVDNLQARDVGIVSLEAPETDLMLGTSEQVTVTIHNFGGEPQGNFPVQYSIDGGQIVTETFGGNLGVGEQAVFTFNTRVDLSASGSYEIFVTTALEGDVHPENDSVTEVIANLNCIPNGSDCSFGDGISNFYLEDIINENIPCGTGYNDYIGYSTELDRTQGTFTVTVTSRYAKGDDERFSMWIDFDDNGNFEPAELLIDREVIPSANTKHSYQFELPVGAPLGEHLLRVKAGDTSFDDDLNDPCQPLSYGTTHDYSIVITDSSLQIEDLELTEAELIVTNRENDLFMIRMQTSYEETLRITVHDLLGQKLVENKVDKIDRIYAYELDMSYAAPGVYLVRLGTRKVGKVARIIVK